MRYSRKKRRQPAVFQVPMWTFATRRPLALLTRVSLVVLVLALFTLPSGAASGADNVDEVHYTFTGSTSVAFDWRGSATDIQYGTTAAYGQTATAQPASPAPISSAGPFQE